MPNNYRSTKSYVKQENIGTKRKLTNIFVLKFQLIFIHTFQIAVCYQKLFEKWEIRSYLKVFVFATSDAGATLCTSCLMGTYKNTSGNGTCQTCPEGYKCPTTTAEPIVCGPGEERYEMLQEQ